MDGALQEGELRLDRNIQRVRTAVVDVESWLQGEDELSSLVRALARRLDEVHEVQLMQERRLELRNLEVHELYAKMSHHRADGQIQAQRLADLKATVDAHHGLLAEHQSHFERELCGPSDWRTGAELAALKAARGEPLGQRAVQAPGTGGDEAWGKERRGSVDAGIAVELSGLVDRLSGLEEEFRSNASEGGAQSSVLAERLDSLQAEVKGRAGVGDAKSSALGERLDCLEAEFRSHVSSCDAKNSVVVERLDGLETEVRSHASAGDAKSSVLVERLGGFEKELGTLVSFKAQVEGVLRSCEDDLNSIASLMNAERGEGNKVPDGLRSAGLVERLEGFEKELRALAGLNDQGFSMTRGTLDKLHSQLLQDGLAIEALKSSTASLEGEVATFLEKQTSIDRRLQHMEEAFSAQSLTGSRAAEPLAQTDTSTGGGCSAGGSPCRNSQEAQLSGSRDPKIQPRRVVHPVRSVNSSNVAAPATGEQRSLWARVSAPAPGLVANSHTLEPPMPLMSARRPSSPTPLLPGPLGAAPPGPLGATAPGPLGAAAPLPMPLSQGLMGLPVPPPLGSSQPALALGPLELRGNAGAVCPSPAVPTGPLQVPAFSAPAPLSSPSGDLFGLIDANHDGQISRAEWKQAFP